MAEPLFKVVDLLPQELAIQIQGCEVGRMQPHAPPAEEAPRPELGDLIVRAARAGLFAGASASAWAATAQVIDTTFDLAARRARWRISLAGIDAGAFRIIWNLLRSMDLEEALMATVEMPGAQLDQVAPLYPERLSYPGVVRPLPFALDVEAPLRSKNRSIQIVFAAPPSEAAVDAILATFELWSELLILGGYPPEGVSPAESGAMPDPPFLLDEVTIEQAFSEHFAADEAAFNAMINHAAAVHYSGVVVSEVIVR